MSQFDDNPYSNDAGFTDDKIQSNPLGIVGFVLSLLCITSPLGLLISLIALFKNPKGFAIAGVILGMIGTAILGIAAWIFMVFGTLIFSMIHIGVDLEKMQIDIENYVSTNQELPASLDDIGWTGTDPWDNEYVYTLDAETQVWSLRIIGPDGTAETDDDLLITSTMSESESAIAFSEWSEALFMNATQNP